MLEFLSVISVLTGMYLNPVDSLFGGNIMRDLSRN